MTHLGCSAGGLTTLGFSSDGCCDALLKHPWHTFFFSAGIVYLEQFLQNENPHFPQPTWKGVSSLFIVNQMYQTLTSLRNNPYFFVQALQDILRKKEMRIETNKQWEWESVLM